MKDNPFISSNFVSKWRKHFIPNTPVTAFKELKSLSFYKNKTLPIYINLGRNHTKGLSYKLSESPDQSLNQKVFLIYDVPSFESCEKYIPQKNIKVIKAKQYPGYLIDLEKFKDINAYLQDTFSKSSRYKLKKYWKRLELCFPIEYTMHIGQIDKEHYDYLFDCFYALLIKRFENKQIYNNNLDPEEWEFYRDMAYPMILAKQASLFVIYNENVPIGITLNFVNGTTLIDAITVFDTDYSKFHLGSVTILKQIEWCLNNNFKKFDFSKGHFDYKDRWSNQVYHFNYHIIYDSSSLLYSTLAKSIYLFYKLKQYLRTLGINTLLHQYRYQFTKNTKDEDSRSYSFTPIAKDEIPDGFVQLKNPFTETNLPKSALFDFLYLNQTKSKDLEVFSPSNRKEYLLKAGNKKALVAITSDE